MIVYRKIDLNTGMFTGIIQCVEQPVLETSEPDPAYIDEPVPPDIWWPRWDFGTAQWVEARTPEEVAVLEAYAHPTPPEPTQAERNAADIQYIAMMTGVDLNV